MKSAVSIIFNDKRLLVLLALMLITLVSWLVAHVMTFDAVIVGCLIILFAFVKVRLIIRHFMDVHLAPLIIRIAFDAWILVVAGVTIALYVR